MAVFPSVIPHKLCSRLIFQSQIPNQFHRYPDDGYDRIWNPLLFDEWIPISSSTVYSLSNDNAYNIPDVVLRTAAKSQNSTTPLILSFSPPDSLSQCYVYFHFAEIEKLENGQQRELTILLNGERYLTQSARLDYLNSRTILPTELAIMGERLEFSIIAAEGSKFPPILNAVEIFVSKELPNKTTAIQDVEAIVEIKKLYKLTRNWQGDPCVPREYSWDGLHCSYIYTIPSIISVNLSSSNLTGKIATSFLNLKAIESLDLSYNDLTGPLPEFLAQLPNLYTLDLRGNKFTGSIPEDLLQKSRDGTLVLSVNENPDPCQSVACKRGKKKEFVIPVVASSTAAVLLLLFIFSGLAIYKQKRHGGMVTKSNIRSKNQRYSYSEVVSITNNFETIIGGGGFGKVYLGKLKDEVQVAVKLLSPSSNQGYKEFQAEAQLLMIVHHRNLVSLVGYCDEDDQKALIYEYMENGNLHQHLSVKNTNVMTWNERLNIAVDAAHGLEYLHNGCKPPIIHRDLKTSNILLTGHMQAKIADFGLSRIFATESDSHVSTCLAGTLGYLDPEYQASGNFSKKSDVYSFGIVLLELITGRPAIMRGLEKNTHILDWIYPIIESGDIQSVVDPRLQGKFHTNSAWKAVEIALSCIPPIASQRPDISQVLAELKECLALEMTNASLATERNMASSSIPLETSYLELESDIAALAR
ncbi:putative leucine-rich repeat receptor-like serine/threonine-protein kinase At2g19230 isoform X2 [Quercus suber]|uniref:putative leucine-rich repeat receptor-like serine/threonine-protein kinase At2g19230 isoform X2 n=1 Tax=Quercus suber TaxID=58331 RepID=UPI0032DE914D